MAYYDPHEDEENPNAPTGGAPTGPESSVISGQGGSSSNASSSGTSAKTPANPGNFVGIQQYLEQNKPQSAKLAENVGSYVTAQGTAAQQALDQGQTQYNQAIGQNTVGLNQDLFNEAKATPETIDADTQKKSDFQKMRDAQYQGPQSLESTDYYQPINMAIQNALGTADKTKSAEGRASILADMEGANHQQVSRGAANLDAALLGVSPDSQRILSNARDQISPLQSQLQSASQQDLAAAQNAANQTAQTKQSIQDAFSGPNGIQAQLENALKTKAQSEAQQAGNDANAVLNLLKQGNPNISDDQLRLLGITPNQYHGLLADQSFYKDRNQPSLLSDLSQFATIQSPNMITPQNIATPEDYARYQALNDLMGTSNGFLNDPTLAGKANTDLVDFNYGATPNALADRINSIQFTPAASNPNQPVSIGYLNQVYGVNNSPTGSADIALGLAEKGSVGDQSRAYLNGVMNQATNALDQINKAYGTNLSVPKEYYDRALKAAQDNVQSIYNNIGNWDYKGMPNEAQMKQAAQASALIAFLNDLSKDASKVRAPEGAAVKPVAQTPPPGQFLL